MTAPTGDSELGGELRAAVRAFLSRRSLTDPTVRNHHGDSDAEASTWRTIAEELCLPALLIPEEYGGTGASWNELAIVLEEFGSVLLKQPLLSTGAVATTALLACEEHESASAALREIATGQLIATVAFTESPGTVAAARSNDEWILSGSISHVVDGDRAGLIILPAASPSGTALFAVHAGAPGLQIESVPTMDETRPQARLNLDQVPAQLLAEPVRAQTVIDETWAAASIAAANEAVGAAARCLELTVTYASERMQFGQPIGAFQAVQQKCADMLLWLESARSVARHAASLASSHNESIATGALAGAHCLPAFLNVASTAVQIHGGIGVTWEHPAQLFLKRAKSDSLLFGAASRHREQFAASATPATLQPPVIQRAAVENDRSDELKGRIAALLESAPNPQQDNGIPFRRAQFDAGLAWVHFPEGSGGLNWPRSYQAAAEQALAEAGVSRANLDNPIGYGNAAPVIATYGSDWQRGRFLRDCFSNEDIWCQLMSEPGAGSDVAGLSTRAEWDGEYWRITGQKVWTSFAHIAKWGLVVARTNPDVPKHAGITCFIIDMSAPGVDVRPLRMLTGKSDFNEVFLDDVRVPDTHRVGPEGEGWNIVRFNLDGERASFGAVLADKPPVAVLLEHWRARDDDDAVLRDNVMTCVINATAADLTARRAERTGGVHPAVVKILSSESLQDIYEQELDLLGTDGSLQSSDGYAFEQPTSADITRGGAVERYLRSRALTIEGGTSIVMRNTLAERALQLPRQRRADVGLPWREVPRTPAAWAARRDAAPD